MIPGVVGADDVCAAIEATLREHLEPLVGALGVADQYGGARFVKTWQQLPTREAIVSANFPAIAITTPGLTGAPEKQRSSDGWSATWRAAIGVYDRGADHAETQARVRDWCGLIRTVLVNNRSLGGLSTRLRWVGEEYALVPQKEKARTFGGGAVAVDVTVPVPQVDPGQLPVVGSTYPSLTVQPPEE